MRFAWVGSAAAIVAATLGACAPAASNGEPTGASSASIDDHPSDLVGAWRWIQGDRFYDFLSLMEDGRAYGYHDDGVDKVTWSVDASGLLHVDGAAYALERVEAETTQIRITRAGKSELLELHGSSCDAALDCVGALVAPNVEVCVQGNVVRVDCVHHGCAAHCTPNLLACRNDADCPRADDCVPLCPPPPPGEMTCLALGNYCKARD